MHASNYLSATNVSPSCVRYGHIQELKNKIKALLKKRTFLIISLIRAVQGSLIRYRALSISRYSIIVDFIHGIMVRPETTFLFFMFRMQFYLTNVKGL